jgi:glutamate synthase (NADPH/NADH) small chain
MRRLAISSIRRKSTMPNMSLKKNSMPTLDPKERGRVFSEVALGYTEEQAIDEANRCLNCKNFPCVSGCPVRIRIPEFIAKIRELDFEGAYRIISESSSLPAVCGRVCPQETQCESKCVRGIKGEPVGIGRLERFVADWHNAHSAVQPTEINKIGKRVAIVGSGPSGLTCAGDLARRGYSVTIFEALHTAGGVLVYGIPEFRLPKSIVAKEVESLKAMGVEILTNMIIGKTLTVDELFEMGYEAVFIGSGAGLPSFMGIPGESLNGVYSANEFLTRANLMKAYREDSETPVMNGGKVAVVGGGNVAMDAARTALRLGAEKVYIVYRRSMDELPARREEVEHAIEEGIEFKLLNNPVEILGYENPKDKCDPKNGFVRGMRCIRMELGEPDERGRRRPVEVKGSEFDLDVDTVIISIGTTPNPLIKNTTEGLDVNSRGGIVVTEDAMTSRKGVFAGGDAVTGAATVISAMGAGKLAAEAIDNYLAN